MRSFTGPVFALALALPFAHAQTTTPAAAPVSPKSVAPAAPRRPEQPQQPTLPVPSALRGTVTFACGAAKNGAFSLFANTLYSETSAGWDLNAAPKIENGTCSSSTPFFFSIPVPEGNYRVKILFGGPADSVTTVHAEARHLKTEQIEVKANATVIETFDVNVHAPEFLNPDGTLNRVRLGPSEFGSLDWDNKLTLEFDGTNASFHSFSIEPLIGSHADEVVYLAGDSATDDRNMGPSTSWGQQLPRFFRPGVAVFDDTESGESAGPFLDEQRFAKIVSRIKPGDFFFMQFNRNDRKADAASLERYSQILTQFVAQVRAKGGVAVIVTAMDRMAFDTHGHIANSPGDYADAARKVAADNNVQLIDLAAMSKTLFAAMGPEGANHAFMKAKKGSRPGTGRDTSNTARFSDYGAYELARCVVQGIRKDKLSIASFLDPTVPAFDPAHPDAFAGYDLPYTPPQKDEDAAKIPQP